MQAPGKGQFQAGIPTAQASGVNVAANDPVPNALGNAANAIENAGNLAQELEQEQERQYMAQAEIKMSKASADLQLELVGNANPQDHVDLAREKYDSLKADVLSSGRFNPRFEQLLSQRFDLYAGKNIEKIALNSRLLQVENGKKLQIARAENYREQGDFESQRSVIKEGTGTYWSAEEEQAAMMKIDRAEEDWKFKVDLNNDPEGVAEKLKDKSYRPEINPLERIKAQEDARRLIAGRTEAGVKRFQDGLATGEMGTPEKIDEAFGPSGENLRPSVIERMKFALADRTDERAKAVHSTPEWQNQNYGKLSQSIASIDKNSDDYAERYAEIATAIDRFPDGLMKQDLSKEFRGIREDQQSKAKTGAEIGKATILEAAKNGFFGKPKIRTQEISLQDALSTGLLRDRDSLLKIGLPDADVTAITGKDAKGKATSDNVNVFGQPVTERTLSDSERIDIFQKAIGKIPGDKRKMVELDPLKAAAYQAVIDNAGPSHKVIYEDPSSVRDAAISDVERETRVGVALRQYQEWHQANPEAKAAEIDAKVFELAGQHVREQARASRFGGRPTQPTSGTRVTSFGYPGDSTPDGNSKHGIGAWVSDKEAAEIKAGKDTPNKMKEGDFGLSPDQEALFRASGINPGDTVTLQLAGGKTIKGRWMDRTANDAQAAKLGLSPLRGRIDIYSPKGSHELNGRAVTGWRSDKTYNKQTGRYDSTN